MMKPGRVTVLSLAITLLSTPVLAASGQITFVSQGGVYQEAQTKAIQIGRAHV